jgi:hypothetical protein
LYFIPFDELTIQQKSNENLILQKKIHESQKRKDFFSKDTKKAKKDKKDKKY